MIPLYNIKGCMVSVSQVLHSYKLFFRQFIHIIDNQPEKRFYCGSRMSLKADIIKHILWIVKCLQFLKLCKI